MRSFSKGEHVLMLKGTYEGKIGEVADPFGYGSIRLVNISGVGDKLVDVSFIRTVYIKEEPELFI